MALYSLESSKSPQRVAGQFVAVDTSYLISLSDPVHNFNPAVSKFHTDALAQNAGFAISVTVRHEFMKMIRKNLFANAMNTLASNNAALHARYQGIIHVVKYQRRGQSINVQVTLTELAYCCEAIVKDHAKAGDTFNLLGAISTDVWTEVQRLERQAGTLYMSSVQGNAPSWDELGKLMELTGIAATDGMIVNMALFLEIGSIVTTDCDFVCVSDIMDVYMPLGIARQCSVYDPTQD